MHEISACDRNAGIVYWSGLAHVLQTALPSPITLQEEDLQKSFAIGSAWQGLDRNTADVGIVACIWPTARSTMQHRGPRDGSGSFAPRPERGQRRGPLPLI